MAKRTKRRGWLIPLILVVGLSIATINVFPIRQLIAQNRDIQAREAELSEIQQENARLRREIESLHNPTEIERIARSDFGYVRPGEISYVVVPVEATEVSNQAPETAEEPAPEFESGGFWDALWDYLTGRDLVDG